MRTKRRNTDRGGKGEIKPERKERSRASKRQRNSNKVESERPKLN